MIVDFDADRDLYGRYYVVDAETGEPIGLVFYADDEAGYCRRRIGERIPGKPGTMLHLWHKVTHERPTRRLSDMPREEAEQYEYAWEEVRRPIRILPMPPIEG